MKCWLKIDDTRAGFAFMDNLTLIFLWGGGVWPLKKCDRYDTARAPQGYTSHAMSRYAMSR